MKKTAIACTCIVAASLALLAGIKIITHALEFALLAMYVVGVGVGLLHRLDCVPACKQKKDDM